MALRPLSLAAAIRLCVYGMLVLSAAMTWLCGDDLWRAWRAGEVPVWAPIAPLATFAAFVGVYTVDRYLLVVRRGYSASRALWQVSFALLFLTLLLPGQVAERRAARQVDLDSLRPAMLLLEHDDPRVREAACALLARRFEPLIYERVQSMAHHDPDGAVREGCTVALQRLHKAAVRRHLQPAD
jgi:hypothetical protein